MSDVTETEPMQPVLCALGASAGGLAPVEEFFDAMPPDTGMSFVVVQHLSPDYESLMVPLLQGHTAMPVSQAVDGVALAPNHVYLIPPGAEISVRDSVLQVRARQLDRRQLHQPVDTFFRSMAIDYGRRSAAVVLSGTGSDGTSGIESVRRAGGLTLVQDSSAAFDGMPQMAFRSGFVDLVLSPTEIAKVVVDFHETGARPANEPDAPTLTSAEVGLLNLIEASTGVSFGEYKAGTIQRRIERQVALREFGDTAKYLERIRDDQAEIEELGRELLIDVTSFFRDPEMFQRLERDVIPQLVVEAASSGLPLRVWIAGCASGEEAYSIAMVLTEAVDQVHGARPAIQLFATDIHSGSLERAAEGWFSDSVMEPVSTARRERFFDQVSDGWKVKPELRTLVTFAQHNLLTDAPFTRIDLVTCRNVLIYFQSGAQDNALSAMSYAIRPGGILALGSSESLGSIELDYDVVSSTWRLFRKKTDAVTRSLRASHLAARLRVPMRTPAFAADQRLLRTYDALLEANFVSGILLSERRELVHTIGGATNWMRQPSGRPTLDALSMVDDANLRLALGASLRELEGGALASEPRIVVDTDAENQHATLYGEVIRVGPVSHYLLHTRPVREALEPALSPQSLLPVDVDEVDYTLQLEAELLYTRESLQAALEEQETSNEELNASNEELVASNEELQSTNEELSSVNEELRTLNDEHHMRLDQVLELSADLEQLMAATDIGVVFLAEDRTIRRFNEPAREYFRVRDGDVDRPFEDIVSRLAYEDLDADIHAVFEGSHPRSRQVSTFEDRHRRLIVRIDRYELPRERWGVFIAVVDVSDVAVAEEERALAALLSASPLSIAVWDEQDRLLYRNRSVEAGEEPIPFDADNPVAVPDGLRDERLLVGAERARVTGATSVGIDRRTEGRDPAPGFEEYVYALYPLDLDDRRLVGAMAVPASQVAPLIELHGQRKLYSALSAHRRLSVVMVDHDGQALEGYIDGETVSGSDLAQQFAGFVTRDGTTVYEAADVDGDNRAVDNQLIPVDGDARTAAIAVGVDIGDLVARVDELTDRGARLQSELTDAHRDGAQRAGDLAERNQDLDNFAHVAAHDLKAPIRSVRSFAELARQAIDDGNDAGPHLDRVIEASQRMTSLLESLLDFASIDRQRPESVEIDLREILDDVQSDLAVEIDRSGAVIRLPAHTDPVVGDAAGLRQVLANLVHNAIKYSEDEPVIDITSRIDGDGVVLVVNDRGPGFDMREAERIFEPFQRLHDTSISGNGVGLAICKRIVERQRGRIWASSEPGHGSRFSVWLPASGEPDA